MLVVYTRMLPSLLPVPPPPSVRGIQASPWALNGTRALVSTAILAILTTTVLVFRGPPALDTSSESIQPRECRPLDEFRNAVKRLGAGQLSFPLLITADSDVTMLERLREVDAELSDHPEVGAFTLPTPLWPDPARQQSNQTTLARLAASGPSLLHEAEHAGFTGDALEFLKSVAAWWDVWSRSEEPSSQTIQTRPGSSADALNVQNLPITRLDWLPSGKPSLPRPRAQPRRCPRLVHRLGVSERLDSRNDPARSAPSRPAHQRSSRNHAVLRIPLSRELILALCSLALGVACFLALMSLLNWKWNLVNLMAFPLLLGAGIDYSIHILFALRHMEAMSGARMQWLVAHSSFAGHRQPSPSPRSRLPGTAVIRSLGLGVRRRDPRDHACPVYLLPAVGRLWTGHSPTHPEAPMVAEPDPVKTEAMKEQILRGFYGDADAKGANS